MLHISPDQFDSIMYENKHNSVHTPSYLSTISQLLCFFLYSHITAVREKKFELWEEKIHTPKFAYNTAMGNKSKQIASILRAHSVRVKSITLIDAIMPFSRCCFSCIRHLNMNCVCLLPILSVDLLSSAQSLSVLLIRFLFLLSAIFSHI